MADNRTAAAAAPRGWLPAFSFYGTGISLLGYRRLTAGRYEALSFVTVLFVPVVPLGTWLIEPLRLDGVNLGAVVGNRSTFRVIARRGTSVWRVLQIYGGALTLLAAALTPLALAVRSTPPKGTPLSNAQTAAFMLALFWLLFVFAYSNRLSERPFEESDVAGGARPAAR